MREAKRTQSIISTVAMRCCAWVLALPLLTASFARAQGVAQTLSTGGGEAGPEGFHIGSVSIYGAYSSTSTPFGSGLGQIGSSLGTTGVAAGPNYLAGISGAVGWRRTGARTIAFLSYTPSYDASIRYFTANSFNNFLSFGVIRDLSPRWTWITSGSAMTARWDQFLFSPTILGSIAGTPLTFDQLVQGLLSGKYTSGQLASILTGSPQLESPAATLLYGTRFFNSSLRTGLTYDVSGSLKLHFDATGTRTQHLKVGDLQQTNTLQTNIFLVPETTTASADLGATYEMSPFTFLELDAKSSRVFSRIANEYISDATVGISRVIGRRVIVQVRGGGGIINPIRSSFTVKPVSHYLAGGTLTYKTYSHTFMGSFDHTLTDSYGLGGTAANVGSAAWNWHIPGHTWSVSSMGRYEFIQDAGIHNINGWLANAGLSRRLSTYTLMRGGYFYGKTSGIFFGELTHRPIQGVELVFTWSPQEPFGL